MSLRERVRLLRKELCDEVIVELDRLEAEIASLRADRDEARKGLPTRWVSTLQSEIASLRAELATANDRIVHMSKVLVDAETLLGVEETGELILRPIERLIAARQDDEEIASLRAELASVRETFNTAIRSRDSVICGLRIDAERHRAELDAEREKAHYANGVADLALKHRDAAENAVAVYVAATARQDKEKAQLTEAVQAMLDRHCTLARKFNFQVCGCADCIPFRAALACRPQGERSEP